VKGWDVILAAARPTRRDFTRACADPRTAQLRLLRKVIAANAETEFGREYCFHTISSLESFRSSVPIQTYDELRGRIDRIADGQSQILTHEPVIAFEATGGSTSGRKLIPYTASSLAAFRAAVLPWLAELAERRPRAIAGRAYVAVSPAARPCRRIGDVRVGLASEGAYLGADLVPAFASLLVTPQSLSSIADIDEWRFATLLHVLAAPDLSFISCWSPTFLMALLDAVQNLGERLTRAIHDGPHEMGRTSAGQASGDPLRARIVERALAANPIDTRLLWPRLDTVSVWADGSSRAYARRLQEVLPHVALQPKGLLATEGAVSLPYGSAGAVPALLSAFVEFVDEAGEAHLCDALRAGETYRVIITTAGGLYRYDLGDRVRCQGHAGPLPLLEFAGRAGLTSDLVGEKLEEPLVIEALGTLQETACLVPHAGERPFYELLVETGTEAELGTKAARVEARLRANPQYAYARALRQLGPMEARAVPDLLGLYTHAELQRGRRLADIKPPTLITSPETCAALTNHVDAGRDRVPQSARHA
jgi:hypothetical protein